jgi:DNA-binding transcriptional regulator YiaG
MSDIAAAFKSEILRLSKKVIREHLNPLKSASLSQRRQIADLKDQLTYLGKEVSRLSRAAQSAPAKANAPADSSNLRFVAKGFKTHRARLGLSAEEAALILGVSGQTVFNWEKGTTKPRADQLPAISALRKMGKREAIARLLETASPKKPRRLNGTRWTG